MWDVEKKIIVCVLVHDNNEGLIFIKISVENKFEELVVALPTFLKIPYTKLIKELKSFLLSRVNLQIIQFMKIQILIR